MDGPQGRACRLVVVIPTYNERENLPDVVRRIHATTPDVDVLVVDDNSPDGTGALADQLARHDDRVKVLHRSTKEGLGRAYQAGFARVLDEGYDVIGEMDADGSHRPEDLPRLLDAIGSADLVIGSRWIPGGSTVNWPRRRQWLSRTANTYARAALGVPVRDATAGFRLYRREVFDQVRLDSIGAQGYVFQTEMVWRTWRSGLRVVEVPITFVERTHGYSKMSADVAWESLRRITRWGAAWRWKQLRGSVR